MLSSNDISSNELSSNDISSNELKIQGNFFFKNEEYNKANDQYFKALNKTNSDKELSILYSNISATYCKLEEYNKALENATIATKKNSEWYKSWYRLSFVLYKLNKLDQAKTSINKTLELCENDIPNDIEFIKDLKKVIETDNEIAKLAAIKVLEENDSSQIDNWLRIQGMSSQNITWNEIGEQTSKSSGN